jgi:hypothetical protein
MHAATTIVGWLVHLAVSTAVLSLLIYVACRIAFEPPSAVPVLLTALSSQSIDSVPRLVGDLSSVVVPALVDYGASVVSCVVLVMLLVRLVGLRAGVAVYVALITIMLEFGLFFLGLK